MTVAAVDVVRGVAVIVDDKIETPEGGLATILQQLDEAGLPVLRLAKLPAEETLVHWKQFGLIVLDWELSYAEAEDVQMPAGVTVPSTLSEDSRDELIHFIRQLLGTTTLPIFIASNTSKDIIESRLDSDLADIAGMVENRVTVFAKDDLAAAGVFQAISDRIAERPSLVALRAWNRAYLEAEIETFHQFSEQSEDWVSAVKTAAKHDGSSLSETLRELLSRNIFNRIGPLDHQLDELGEFPVTDASALRRVLHLSAVIPDSSLQAGVLGTGDLFVAESAGDRPEEIRILITPDCDLPRKPKVRALYVTAKLDHRHEAKESKKRRAYVANPERGFLASCLLTPAGDEYVIRLVDWESTWLYADGFESGEDGQARPTLPLEADLLEAADGLDSRDHESEQDSNGQTSVDLYAMGWPGYRRIGRLMEPHLTHIQQNFSLATIRKGLPAIPDDFFN